jgi:hypothetical protein
MRAPANVIKQHLFSSYVNGRTTYFGNVFESKSSICLSWYRSGAKKKPKTLKSTEAQQNYCGWMSLDLKTVFLWHAMTNWCVWWREMRRWWNRVFPQWEKKTELLLLLNVNQILRWEFHLSGFKKNLTDLHQFLNFGDIFWVDSEIFWNVLETLRANFVLKITSNLTESQSLDILGEVWVRSGFE